jgi:hypothetical protein
MFRVLGICQRFQQTVITVNAAAIVRRAGVRAAQTDRVLEIGVWRQHFFHCHFVFPAVAKVVAESLFAFVSRCPSRLKTVAGGAATFLPKSHFPGFCWETEGNLAGNEEGGMKNEENGSHGSTESRPTGAFGPASWRRRSRFLRRKRSKPRKLKLELQRFT